MNFKKKLKCEIVKAVKKILSDLLANGEHYYYITLVTDGLANTPCVSAWSLEALEREQKKDAENAEMIKWSYADSPYCGWKQEYFKKVDKLLCGRENISMLDDEDFEREYELRISAMEEAMKELDCQGIFMRNQERKNVLVLVEVMPPDSTNTSRAYEMNDSNTPIFAEWLEEAAEEE